MRTYQELADLKKLRNELPTVLEQINFSIKHNIPLKQEWRKINQQELLGQRKKYGLTIKQVKEVAPHWVHYYTKGRKEYDYCVEKLNHDYGIKEISEIESPF